MHSSLTLRTHLNYYSMLAIADIKILIQAGGVVRINAGHYASIDLKACALLAQAAKVQLLLTNAKALAAADLKLIARSAPGVVIFELDS